MMETSSLWLGIKQFSGGNVTLRHTTVRQAVVGIQGNGSNIHISNSDIYSCVQGLLLSGGISANQLESGWGPILFKTKVTNNEQGTRMHGVLGQEIMLFEATDFDLNNYGIEVENWANIQTQIISTILLSENVSMSNNRNYGLYIKIGSPTVVDVRGSMFVGNRNGGVYWYQYYTNNPRQAFTITDTLFEDTNFGISYTCNYCRTSNMTVTIASNTFNDNKRDIYITFHSSEQSFIVQNVFSKSQEVLAIQSDTSMETNISVIISENSFVNLLRGYTAVSVSFVKTIISKNSFNNCSSTTLISVKNGFDHLIANNTFVNSTDSICYVQTKQPYTKGKTISASLNYWDTNDIFAVKSKVCDFFVDSSTAIIDVKGFYEDFSMKKLNYSKAIDMFRSAINETTNITYIGGIVDDDIDISTLGVSRFMLNRSLLIQEGVTVRIQGVTLNITDVKGIVVLGTLVIGSSDSVDRTVIQKHSGVWNSIVLYNTGLNVLNTNISGAVAAIDIRSSSSVYIHNCTAYDGAMQSLIKADKPKHNVSVHISNCIVSVDANVIEIVVNDSQSIDVNIENSTMTSNRNYIVSVTDGSSNRSPKLVRVSVLGSHSYGGVGVLNIRGCFFRTELTIVDSEFAATRYGTLVSLANPSMKTEAHRNKFGDSRRDFYLEFCKPLTDVMNNSTTFNMVNNIFKSQSDGEVFYMYDYSGATEHTFNFTNNSMVYMQPTARQFLFITSYGNSEKHTLNFISNTLVNSSKTLLEIHHRFRQITLKWNKFINNSACLLYSAPPHTDKFLGFEIDRNEFQGNTHIDGIIVISTEQFQNGTVSLTNNDFINNMGTSFSFKTSNVSIKYNYFENPEALYNLKVNKFVTLTNVRTDINASFNYWGTTDPRDIENKLYDKSYDETLLDILYRPYLGSRNISDFRNEEINFVNGNEIGGNVNGDVTLHSDKGPYVVVSNIVVGENDTLTIQEGVEIRVMADIGFTVLGILISQGTSQRPVRFISVDHLAPWKGIELNSKHGVNITHLLVNNTKEGITLKTTKATLHDVTSTFSRTSGFYIFATDNKQNVTAVSVSKLNASNNADGVTINAGTGYNNYISILNCIVADNTADGIVTMSTGNVTISKCTIERNKARGMKLDMRTNGFIKVVKSLIRNNSEYALEGEVTAGIEMDSCTISDHRLGYNNWGWYPRVHTHLRISASNSKLTTVDIKNSIITNNTADGILLTRSYNNRGPLAITVDNNTFNIGNVAFEFNDEHKLWVIFF
ncbi:hypothetical protein DPMN_105410 [Dreissena polymorpha]|uniref:Right handed beta helix domain-containing protein n=1 Tax=Dreissena polymorpha TaxID=45954 RepID=A0A9D4HBK1_DREPO|nr:hypothetical protein DPMN_105410 [Dreissena polymorpha]